jgi:tetratricopeptide (TPR) repeat protein
LLTLVALASLALVASDASAAREKKKSAAAERKKAKASAASVPDRCKEPAAIDPQLVSGLQLYLDGKWKPAADALLAWGNAPGAETDPSAGRGFYSLGYALRLSGQQAAAEPWLDKARPLLEQRIATSPTLEAYYYLASLHQARNDTSSQLSVVSAALKDMETGTLCPGGDGDDVFRASRIASFAGRKEQQVELLRKAATLYAEGKGSVTAYRSLAEKEMGDAARDAGDLAAWEKHAMAAAAIDPTIAGVHQAVGLAKLRQGDVKGAADYWRKNWRLERNNGNGLIYCVSVLDGLLRGRERFGEAHRIGNLAEHTAPALEQNAIYRAKDLMGTLAQVEEARSTGAEPDPALLDQAAASEYEMHQFLAELVGRGADIQELALQNGLVAAIMRRDLPRR